MARNFIPLVPSGTINADASVAQLEQDVLAMDSKVGELAEDIGDTEQEINQLKSQINEVEASFPQKSASGSIVTIEDGADNVPVVSLTAQIVPVQSGTGDPAPDNVRPISGWTGANIYVTGKNLAVTVSGLNVSGNGTVVSESGYTAVIAKITQGQTYTTSKNGTAEIPQAMGFYSAYPSVGAVSYNSQRVLPASATFTAPIDGWVLARMAITAQTGYQIEKGSSASAYESFNGISIAFPDEAGTVYGGSIRLNQDGTADLTVDTFAKIFTGADGYGWTTGVHGNLAYTALSYLDMPLPPAGTSVQRSNAAKCNMFKPQTKATWVQEYDTDNTVSFSISGDSYFGFNFGYDLVNAAGVNAKLAELYAAGTPLTVVYPLAETTTYHITDVDLVKTLYGLNNIWADTGDIDVTYRADPATYTAEQIRIMLNAMVAPVEASTTASKAYSVNDFLILDNVLYKVIANIANGGTITINTNVSATTIGAEITNILNT